MNKITAFLSEIRLKNCAVIFAGSAILAFGLYNVHAVSGVTEGGVLGLTLLLHNWFDISPSVSGLVLNILCYLLGIKTLGKKFIAYSAVSTVAFSAAYAVCELFPPLWPQLADMPLLASVAGALFVGIGAGLCVRMGGATGGDDALAMSIAAISGMGIQWIYLISDLVVLLLSLTYIPLAKIIYSLLTVVLSGQIIGLLQKNTRDAENERADNKETRSGKGMEISHIQHFGLARKIVANMTAESWETIPHSCAIYEPEVTGFLDELKKINAELPKEQRVSVNTAMLKLVIEGLKAAPKLNAHIEFNRRFVKGHVKYMKNIDISQPVILKTGEMMTLTIRNMEDMNLYQIRDTVLDSLERANNSELNEVMFSASMHDSIQKLKRGRLLTLICRLLGAKFGKHKIKTLSGQEKRDYYSIPEHKRLTKHDIVQGTITVSNIGSTFRNFRGACTILEIIPPQVACVAIGSVQDSVFVDPDGSIRAGKKLPFTLAVDHRALDWTDLVPFMVRLDEIFAHPEVIREWL